MMRDEEIRKQREKCIRGGITANFSYVKGLSFLHSPSQCPDIFLTVVCYQSQVEIAPNNVQFPFKKQDGDRKLQSRGFKTSGRYSGFST